jgi:hypothetical protein
MKWNYRLIDRSHKNGGEPWLEIVEVYYDEHNKLIGFSEPCLNAENKEEVISTLQMVINDISKENVLNVSDFGMTTQQDTQ